MKVLAYRGPGPLKLEDRPEPRVRDGEVLIRVDACAICGTDLRIAAGSHRYYVDASGRVPGHEVVGTVVKVGAGAEASLGDVVFVAPNYGCQRCRACNRGLVNLCGDSRAVGITDDGGFSEYLLLNRELVVQGNLLRVPRGVDPAALALAEPLACALRGSRACRIGPGDVVLVYGAGPMGLFHVALARLAGAQVVVTCDPHAERRHRALMFGATSSHEPDADQVRAAIGSEGADAVIVATPVATAQRQALDLAAVGGRVNFFAGLPRASSVAAFDTNLIHYKELVVTGTTASTNESCQAALDMIGAGQVDTSSLIDARLDLAHARQAFELAGSGRVMKVVVQP